MRRWISFLVVAVVVALAAGCGSSRSNSSTGSSPSASQPASGGSVTIDVGTGKPVKASTNHPTVDFFTGGSSNLFLKSYNKGVQDEAAKLGLKLTTYDAQFDANRQFNQVQNALQQRSADAFVVSPLDANQMCPVLSRQAPAQNIAVFVSLLPMCGTNLNPEGDQLWVPGTVTMVADNDSVDNNVGWLEAIARRLPGRHTIAILLGPPLIGPTLGARKAIAQLQSRYPNLDFKYQITTDQTTPDSLAKTQTLLQAHPDVDVILSIYSDETVGAAKAIKAAGKQGRVKLFDQGGSAQSAQLIRAGELEMTTVYVPYTYGVESVRAVADAFAGRPVPHYVGAFPAGGSIGQPVVVDATNVGSYRPQY